MKIDERRLLGGALELEIEGIDDVAADERLARRPSDALLLDAVVGAEPRENLQRLLRVDDAPRGGAAHADRVVLVEQHAVDAAVREVAAEREAGEPAAGDHDRVAPPPAASELRRRNERIGRELVASGPDRLVDGGQGRPPPRLAMPHALADERFHTVDRWGGDARLPPELTNRGHDGVDLERAT